MNAAKNHSSATKGGNESNAIAILIADHKKIRVLFKQFEEVMDQDGSETEKAELAQQVCNALTVHTQIEEELFYPAVREAIDNDNLMDEAKAVHAGIQELVEQIEAMQPGSDQYDAKVVVLGEQVEHHFMGEEEEMFFLAKEAKLDMASLGAQMQQRKIALMAELGVPNEPDNAAEASTNVKKKARPTHGRAFT